MAAAQYSDPVFSTKGSPFVEPRSPQGHYHPSPDKSLAQRARHTSLSPVRLQSLSAKAGINAGPPQAQKPGARRDDRQKQRIDAPVAVGTAHSQPDPDSSEPFDESWPSTEQSSARTPEAVEGLAEREPVSPTREPVIARFVERFRHGHPTSRGERETAECAGHGTVWWLQDPSSEATKPTTHTTDHLTSSRSQPKPPRRCSSDRSLGERSSGRSGSSPTSSSLERMRHHNNSDMDHVDLSLSGLMDADMHSLQERANQLLERSESTLSSRAGAVSSEGLGSARSSERNFSEPARPPWGHLSLHPQAGIDGPTGSMAPLVALQPTLTEPLPPSAVTGSTQAGDILYQWRLRRRMEEAREFGTNAAHTQAVPSSDQELPRPTPWRLTQGDSLANAEVLVTAEGTGRYKPTAHTRFQVPVASPHISCSTGIAGSPKESIIVAPHVHLSCDVLPCPHASHIHRESRDEHRPLHTVNVAPHANHGVKEESRSDIRTRNLRKSTEQSGKTDRPATSNITSRSSRITDVNADDREHWVKDSDAHHSVSGHDVAFNRRSGRHPWPAEKALHPPAASADRSHRERAAKPGRERHERRGNGENAGSAEMRDRVPVRPQGTGDGKKRREARGGEKRVPVCSNESPSSSAVGLVISERLFTPTELKVSKTNKPVRDEGRVPRDVAASQPRSPSTESELPCAVRSLLEQAEDSDGEDFPDDLLLKLLREQRNRVRDRLCETTRIISSLELTERPS